MTALWIGIGAGALALLALLSSFTANRRTRRAIHRIDRLDNAPRVEGDVLVTRSGQRISFDDLKGDFTLLVNVPIRGMDPARLARLETVRHRFGSSTLDVVALPVGHGRPTLDEAPRRAGAIPVLAPVESHPLADICEDDFGDLGADYTKLLVDSKGRVVARFSPETDPRGVEVRRAVEAALAN